MVTHTVRIGFAGLYFSNFQAGEYGIFRRSLEVLVSLSGSLDFTLVPCPEPVENRQDAEAACRDLAAAGVDFLLLQASSLMLGDIIEPFGEVCSRIGFWVVPEPTLEGELPLNSLTGFNMGVSILRKKHPDRPVKWFYGPPETDAGFRERLEVTLRGIRTLRNLQDRKIGIMHDVVPTFINLTYDRRALKEHLGVEVVSIPLDRLFTEFRDSAGGSGDAAAIEGEMRRIAREIRVPDAEVTRSAGISGAILTVAREEGLDALALRCWPEFQDVLLTAPCASVSYLNDHGLITSCEGDLPGALSMLAASFLSGEAPTMNDPVALDTERDLVQMWHCGPGPASWADESGQTLDWHHTLNRRRAEGEAKAGLSSDIAFRKGAVTLLHISSDGASLFVMEGDVVEGPAPPYPGSGGWMGNLRSGGVPVRAVDFLESIVLYGFEHHYPVMRGHHEAAVREFASWAGIEVLDVRRAESCLQRIDGPPGGIREDV